MLDPVGGDLKSLALGLRSDGGQMAVRKTYVEALLAQLAATGAVGDALVTIEDLQRIFGTPQTSDVAERRRCAAAPFGDGRGRAG
jgi:hypothetical protein